MTAIAQIGSRLEIDFKEALENFIAQHPYITLAAMAIGVPVSIIFCVFIFTMIFILPLAYIFGWSL